MHNKQQYLKARYPIGTGNIIITNDYSIVYKFGSKVIKLTVKLDVVEKNKKLNRRGGGECEVYKN